MYFSHPTNYAYLIGGAVAIIISILILTKDIRAPLNLLFASSLFLWGISLLFNALTYLFTSPEQNAAHYIRDISTSSGGIGAFLTFITAFTMYKGLHYLKKWYFIFPLVLFCIVDIVIGSIFDYVVTDPDLGGIKTTQKPWVMIFIYGIPVIMLILADIYFFLTRREVEEEIVKKRIFFFILGFFFIILGVLTYAMYGIFEQVFSFSSPPVEFITWVFACLFWIIAPVLMVIGFYIGKLSKDSPKELQTH